MHAARSCPISIKQDVAPPNNDGGKHRGSEPGCAERLPNCAVVVGLAAVVVGLTVAVTSAAVAPRERKRQNRSEIKAGL